MRIIFMFLLTYFFSAFSYAEEKYSYIPPDGFVPDAETAILIAEAVWSPIYGSKKIKNEKPFIADLKGDVWFVKGTLAKGLKGGVAEAEIAKVDGKIIRVSHGK